MRLRPASRAPSPGGSGQRRSVFATALMTMAAFVAVLYLIEFVDTLLDNRLDAGGIEPRDMDGLDGIVFAPLLHLGWGHLLANTVPLLVLGFLIALSGIALWTQVTLVVWLVSGAGTWLVGQPHSIHLGASGLIFGWLTYLIVRGLFNRRPLQVLVGVVVFLAYGGALWGVLPGQPGISWQGHLFGAIGGVLAAWLLSRYQERRTVRSGGYGPSTPHGRR